MNKKMFGLIILVGGILLAFIGTLWAIKALPFVQPMPPIADLLLKESDFPDCGFGCEKVERDAEKIAREMAEFVGLSTDYQEGLGVYFLVYTYPYPKAIVHSLYRYESREETVTHYEHLLEALPLTPLARETPIISRSEWSFKGVKGQIIEAQSPIGTAYWFVGVRGKLLTIMAVLGFESTGEPVFKELLPILVGRMAGLQ